MMKVIGVEAYPVGIMTNTKGDMDVEIPILNENHAISEVYLEGRRVLPGLYSDYLSVSISGLMTMESGHLMR